jgi:tetratricopeptide (TPR) repeat protein
MADLPILSLLPGAVLAARQAQPPVSALQTALALEQEGKTAEAETAWRMVLKAQPSNPEPYARLGLLESRQDHYKEALPLYRKALALNPTMPGLRLNFGLALFKANELKQAMEEFRVLLKAQALGSPEAQRLTILMGMAHYGLNEFGQAVPYLKDAAARDPQNLLLRLTLAHSCLWSKQYECVLDAYREILTLNAESAEADMLAGEALDELKDTDGALRQFRAAELANPKEPNVHYGLGYILWRLMQFEEAAREFQCELDNNPDNGQALTYLADSEMKLGHPNVARPLLEKAIQIDPKSELPHLDLGILHSDAGQFDDALRELKLAETIAPGDTDVHWRLGRLYQATGKKDVAKIEFDKTRSLQKASDETVFKKLHPVEEAPRAPAVQ